MPKWLEELKNDNPRGDVFPKKFGIAMAGMDDRLFEQLYVVLVEAWEQWQLDRLIKIAERAEWYHDALTYWVCVICWEQKDDGHHPTCPYSDDWRKE